MFLRGSLPCKTPRSRAATRGRGHLIYAKMDVISPSVVIAALLSDHQLIRWPTVTQNGKYRDANRKNAPAFAFGRESGGGGQRWRRPPRELRTLVRLAASSSRGWACLDLNQGPLPYQGGGATALMAVMTFCPGVKPSSGLAQLPCTVPHLPVLSRVLRAAIVEPRSSTYHLPLATWSVPGGRRRVGCVR